MGKIKDGKLLYHLTKLANLDSIIKYGLVSRKILEDSMEDFEDVADVAIMNKRKAFGLDKYIPFHFHPYSSFDVAVKNAYWDEEFVYICLQRSLARDNKFRILPQHPLSADDVRLFDYDEGFDQIDWAAMESSSTISEYHKNVRMAECLTELTVPVEFFHSIAVRNDEVQKIVEGKLGKTGNKKTYVNIQPWLGKERR